MVLEYCPGGNLADKVKASGPLPFREFRDVAFQLLDALACCHAAGIAHLDIKPANVFFCEDGKVRLADFGCSRHNHEDNFFGGSRPFMSPEIVCQMGAFNKFKSDIWSLGVTFYYMAAGKLPWRNASSEAIKAEIRIGAYVPLTDVDARIPPLVKSMLRLEPDQRVSLSSLMEMVGSWPGSQAPSRRVLPILAGDASGNGWRVRSRRPLSRSFAEFQIHDEQPPTDE
jgi:serine/threonine protein kinase